MKNKPPLHQHQQLLKSGYFIAGMILSVLFTKIADIIFPPEPVVVHTFIDSVKIVHEHQKRNLRHPDYNHSLKSPTHADQNKRP